MDETSIEKLSHILDSIDIPALSKQDRRNFGKSLGNLYAQLDYIHPFEDGNSRTLREFTHQLSFCCGYELDWNKFDKSEKMRDALYSSRDLSVNKLGIEQVNSYKVMAGVAETNKRLQDDFTPEMADLLKDAVH